MNAKWCAIAGLMIATSISLMSADFVNAQGRGGAAGGGAGGGGMRGGMGAGSMHSGGVGVSGGLGTSGVGNGGMFGRNAANMPHPGNAGANMNGRMNGRTGANHPSGSNPARHHGENRNASQSNGSGANAVLNGNSAPGRLESSFQLHTTPPSQMNTPSFNQNSFTSPAVQKLSALQAPNTSSNLSGRRSTSSPSQTTSSTGTTTGSQYNQGYTTQYPNSSSTGTTGTMTTSSGTTSNPILSGTGATSTTSGTSAAGSGTSMAGTAMGQQYNQGYASQYATGPYAGSTASPSNFNNTNSGATSANAYGTPYSGATPGSFDPATNPANQAATKNNGYGSQYNRGYGQQYTTGPYAGSIASPSNFNNTNSGATSANAYGTPYSGATPGSFDPATNPANQAATTNNGYGSQYNRGYGQQYSTGPYAGSIASPSNRNNVNSGAAPMNLYGSAYSGATPGSFNPATNPANYASSANNGYGSQFNQGFDAQYRNGNYGGNVPTSNNLNRVNTGIAGTNLSGSTNRGVLPGSVNMATSNQSNVTGANSLYNGAYTSSYGTRPTSSATNTYPYRFNQGYGIRYGGWPTTSTTGTTTGTNTSNNGTSTTQPDAAQTFGFDGSR